MARGQTVAVAESSAGGLISAALLAVPGASAYYRGGLVVYTLQGARTMLDDATDLDPGERERMVARTRRTTVPQIFIGDTHVGGYDDMMALHRAGKLEALLEAGQ